MKVLFITRKHPPQVGGMEKYSYELIKNFPEDKEVIALNKPQIHLIWFLPYALIKGIFLSKKVDLVYLCDSLLAPIGLIIKKISRKPVISGAMGLDITYNNWIYQNFNVRCLKYIDKVVAISRATVNECIARGIHRNNCVFIPVGIEKNINIKKNENKDISKFIGSNTKDNKILLTVGRLVKRKGVNWFVKNVLGELRENVIYLIVGDGPEKDEIKKNAIKRNIEGRVLFLGQVSNDNLNLIYKSSDIFVMPNIKVKGDMEGFGIVAIEASMHGLPIIASDLEGIKDAIADNKNGILVNPGDVCGYVKNINSLLDNDEYKNQLGIRFKKYTEDNYGWDKIIKRYINIFEQYI